MDINIGNQKGGCVDISIHGHLRVYDRTKMLPEDVLSLIRANKVVSLGVNNKQEFLLFYSPREKMSKVAIVSADRSTLISVWEIDFNFPHNIIRPTKGMIHQAKTLMNEYLFNQAKKNYSFSVEKILLVKISLLVCDERVYREEGLVPESKTLRLDDLIEVLREELLRISSVVSEHVRRPNILRYEFRFFDRDTGLMTSRRSGIDHKKLIQRLHPVQLIQECKEC